MLILTWAGILAGVFLILILLVRGVVYLLGRRTTLFKIAKFGFGAYVVVLLGTLFVVFPLLAAGFVSDAGTRPMDTQLQMSPGDLGREYREVDFRTEDDVEISGWWMDGDPEKPLLVLTHGLFRDRKEVVERACLLNQKGYPALLFDLRSHGTSGRRSISLGYYERLDVKAAVGYGLGERPGDYVLAAVSMGAVASILALPELPQPPRAVIADSPYLTLRGTVDAHVRLFVQLPAFPFSNVFVWRLGRLSGFSPRDLDVRRALETAKPVPFLLIYGQEDRRMGPDTARAVFEAIPHPDKELVFFEDAGHGAAYRRHSDRYIEKVSEFFARVLRPASESPSQSE